MKPGFFSLSRWWLILARVTPLVKTSVSVRAVTKRGCEQAMVNTHNSANGLPNNLPLILIYLLMLIKNMMQSKTKEPAFMSYNFYFKQSRISRD